MTNFLFLLLGLVGGFLVGSIVGVFWVGGKTLGLLRMIYPEVYKEFFENNGAAVKEKVKKYKEEHLNGKG